MRDQIRAGVKPEAILTWLAIKGGWVDKTKEELSLKEIVSEFRWEEVETEKNIETPKQWDFSLN